MYIFFNGQVYYADLGNGKMYATDYSNGILSCDFKSPLKLPTEIDCVYTQDEILPLLTGYKSNLPKSRKEK